MDYRAGFWGFKTFPKLQTIQNKAIRHVMGVGKNCPVDLLEGDSGWVPVLCRHQFEMLKLWHHLATMDDSWLTKRIFKSSLALANIRANPYGASTLRNYSLTPTLVI